MSNNSDDNVRFSRHAIVAFVCLIASFCAGIVLLFFQDVQSQISNLVAGIIFSVLLIISVGGFFLSLILVNRALKETSQSKGLLKGRWLARLTAVLVLPIIFILYVLHNPPGMIDYRQKGNESAAIVALKNVFFAQLQLHDGDINDSGAKVYAKSLADLATSKLVDPELGSGKKQGYIFTLHRSTSKPETEWSCTAQPEVPGKTGSRYFFIDETGGIRWETGKMADKNSPELL